MKAKFLHGAALAACVGLAACASAPENRPLAAGAGNLERRSIAPPDPAEPVILVAFSGGGARAAALAYSVLHQMRDTTYHLGGEQKRLVDDVRLVSSVSGGSVTAAWFGLRQADGLDELKCRFLEHDNMSALVWKGLNPITWFRMWFGSYTRIDALEELLDQRLFEHHTLQDLNAPGRPFVVFNATDMAAGQSFAFTPRRFDDICSAYDEVPLSVAVSASAAFPVLLTPVNFHNNSPGCIGAPRPAEWISVALRSEATPYLNLPRYRDARYSNDLRHRDQPLFRNVDELHFLDGGLADNLGLQSIRSAIFDQYDDTHLRTAINDGKIGKLVVIVVNARSDPPSALDQDAGAPGIVSMVGSVVSTPIDATTASVDAHLAALLTELSTAASLAPAHLARFAGMQVYAIQVDFDQLPVATDAERALMQQVKNIPTSWNIAPADLAAIEKVGPLLLTRDPCYQKLLADLQAAPPAVGAAVGPEACATAHGGP